MNPAKASHIAQKVGPPRVGHSERIWQLDREVKIHPFTPQWCGYPLGFYLILVGVAYVVARYDFLRSNRTGPCMASYSVIKIHPFRSRIVQRFQD